MTTAVQTPPAQPVQTQVTTNPYVGILAVFLGAGLATLNSRLLSVGLPDLRGALGLGFDEASWIPTALNMATMFSGVFVVFLNAFWGPRRILLPAAAIFTVASALLPFAPNYSGDAGVGGDRRPRVRHLLLSHHDLRVDHPSEAADHLRDRSLCGGHRLRQQHRIFAGGMVHRASVLALDLLDCRTLHSIDDGLCLFRNSARTYRGARGPVGVDSLISALAWLCFTALWIKGSGWTG